MKVTQNKMEANRRNAIKSTGPRTIEGKAKSKANSTRHAFFSKTLRFANSEEESAYHTLARDIRENLQPVGTMEELLTEEVATLYWNLRKCRELIQRQINGYEKPELDPQVAKFMETSTLPEVSIPGLRPQRQGDVDGYSPWEVRELVATVSNDENRHNDSNQDTDFNTTGNNNRYHVQVRLGQSLDTLLRYEGAMARRLDRTIDRLSKLQALREERNSH